MQTTSRRRNKGNKKRVLGRWPGRSEQSSFVRCPCVFSLAGCLHSILQRKKGREAEEDPERNVDEPAVSFRSRSCHSSKYALFFFSETNARAFSCVASMRRQRAWPLVTVCWYLFFLPRFNFCSGVRVAKVNENEICVSLPNLGRGLSTPPSTNRFRRASVHKERDLASKRDDDFIRARGSSSCRAREIAKIKSFPWR